MRICFICSSIKRYFGKPTPPHTPLFKQCCDEYWCMSLCARLGVLRYIPRTGIELFASLNLLSFAKILSKLVIYIISSNCMSIPVSLHSHQHLVCVSDFFFLLPNWWMYNNILICILLVVGELHIFSCLLTVYVSSMKHLFISFAHFLLVCLLLLWRQY